MGGLEDRQGVWTVAVSPDGASIAANIDQDIWLYDVGTGIPTRSTTHPSLDYVPVWSPDGRRYAFTSTRNGANQVFVMDKDDAGEAREVVSIPGRQVRVQDWSNDGDLLLLMVWAGPTSNDVWSYSFSEGQARPFLETSFDEEPGELSPDGRWLAYTSDEAGGRNVYVKAFPGPGATVRVSSAGGAQPRWRGDGRELFYLAPDHAMMSVAITGERQIVPGPPTPLFRKDLNSQGSWWVYDVSPDGERFLVVEPGEGGAISVLVDWPAKLRSATTVHRR
jgi:Tol biopolymer transport system component